MRLDYYCPLYVETTREKAIFKSRELKKFNGHIDPDEDSDFTTHMDGALASKLLGENLTFVFHHETLYARASFHEKVEITVKDREELTEYVIGQMMDGYGSHPLSLRKGLTQYVVYFATDENMASALEFQITKFTPYPANTEQTPSHSFIHGPFESDFPLPASKPKKVIKKDAAEPLINASINGDFEAVKDCIKNGIGVDERRTNLDSLVPDYTALGWAAGRDHFDIAKFLIDNGADPNVVTRSGTPLTAADSVDMVRLLLQSGANPSMKTVDGLTAAEFHRDQSRFYLDESFDMMYDLETGTRLVKMAELIESWNS